MTEMGTGGDSPQLWPVLSTSPTVEVPAGIRLIHWLQPRPDGAGPARGKKPSLLTRALGKVSLADGVESLFHHVLRAGAVRKCKTKSRMRKTRTSGSVRSAGHKPVMT